MAITNPPRIAFAGDRDIAVRVLDFLLAQGVRPLALLVPGPGQASHADELIARCAHLDADHILAGRQFRQPEGLGLLRRLDLDFVIGIHFPLIIPPQVLAAPRQGVLNLHPAFLPYNRGWHTPTWALLDGTPIGATLHFMDEGVDTGDIVSQRELAVSPADTADSLYARLKELEYELFVATWPAVADGSYARQAQPAGAGTAHRRQELFTPAVQQIDLAAELPAGDLLRRLRALTTSRLDEAAYFEADGQRYRVQVRITPDSPQGE